MRRSDKEIQDPAVIEHILSHSEICRIAIPDNEVPYIVPLNYGYTGGSLYFHSSPDGRKMDLLRKNGKVSFEIEYASEIIKGDIPCNWTARYRSLMGTGHIEIIEDEAGIRNSLDLIMAHYGNNQKMYNESSLKRIVILKLNIESISGKQSGDWPEL